VTRDRQQRRIRYAIATALALFISGGCGTITSLQTNEPFPNVIYGGTYLSLQGHATILDVPFSAVADTLVLPYTIPRTIYNCNHPEEPPNEDTTSEVRTQPMMPTRGKLDTDAPDTGEKNLRHQ
jgi:uncharacterized protein YceK